MELNIARKECVRGNPRDLRLEYARVPREGLLVPTLMYGNESVVWREIEKTGFVEFQENRGTTERADNRNGGGVEGFGG